MNTSSNTLNSINKFTKLDPAFATLKGSNLAIEDRTTGKVYITNKPNIDKLFSKIGYKNLNVIKILEEFAGKYISEIGKLNDCSIYLEESTGSFIVTSDNAISWLDDMYRVFSNNHIGLVNYHRSDSCYTWDELIVKSPTKANAYFDICINLVEEYAQVLSMDYDEETLTLKGLKNEGYFRFNDISSLNDLVDLIKNPVDMTYDFHPDIQLSIDEYVHVLADLGFVQIQRGGKAHLTDDGEEIKNDLGNIDNVLDDYNLMNWLQRKIKPINGYDFRYLTELISLYYDRITPWKVKDYYINNSKETSDICLVNA